MMFLLSFVFVSLKNHLIVKRLNLGYDGVIIKNIDEGDTSIVVDDYIVFDPSQVEIVKKYKK